MEKISVHIGLVIEELYSFSKTLLINAENQEFVKISFACSSKCQHRLLHLLQGFKEISEIKFDFNFDPNHEILYVVVLYHYDLPF